MGPFLFLYSLLVSIFIFTDAPVRNVSRWWSLGTFILPLLVPIYLIKTRPAGRYWKYISLWTLGLFVFYGAQVAFVRGFTEKRNPWKEFISEDGGFSVRFPGKPSRDSTLVNSPVGKVEGIQYYAMNNGIAYVVSYADFPKEALLRENPDKFLDNARDGGVANVQGKLLSEIIIEKNDCPGREIVVKVEPDGVLTMQLYLRDNRLFSLGVASWGDKLFTSNRREFFDSFKFLR